MKPFLYAIADVEGQPVLDEICVAEHPSALELGDDAVDKGMKIVPVYTGPQIEAMREELREYKRMLSNSELLIESYKSAREDAYSCDIELAEAIIEIESMRAEDYKNIPPERAWEIHQTLIRAATANAEERNAVATKLGEATHALRQASNPRVDRAGEAGSVSNELLDSVPVSEKK
jgi:hypothetical protein